jgi:hypothetical protein
MRLAGHFCILCLAAATARVTPVVRADDLAVSGNPYSTITERNVFALVPIPPPPPPGSDLPPPDPPPKITVNGLMKLFGKPEALFKFTPKAPAGQPAKEVSLTMGEGERDQEVEVTKIDMVANVVSFINHGVAQDVPLSDMAKITTPAATTGGGVPMPVATSGGGIPMPTGTAAGRTLPTGLVGRARGGNTATAPDAGTSIAPTGSIPSGSAAKTADPASGADNLTPEERALLIEAQRSVWKQQGNPAAAILPPTTQILGRNVVNELNGETTPTVPTAPGH